MSFYDNNTRIIDLTPLQNPCPELMSSIHSDASQKINSNSLSNPSPEPSTSRAILRDFIVDDNEIEEEGVAVKKKVELILNHKHDDGQLLYLVKWDDSNFANSWENAQTINDITMLTTYWEEFEKKKRPPSAQLKRHHYNSDYEISDEDSDNYELVN
ncbi:hypothetical protein GLOIN_2v1620796 [Rhizophagus clarus]|uniref:Chromo domain-containing protein n=1 Tax=Rhizophagus clarus TaxID=94130 RepID=A0A8H3L1V6_9GLOM|nr:hypothetical protein GLOIN_2v1620796 [Rhizophagus clarus]